MIYLSDVFYRKLLAAKYDVKSFILYLHGHTKDFEYGNPKYCLLAIISGNVFRSLIKFCILRDMYCHKSFSILRDVYRIEIKINTGPFQRTT